MSQNMDQRPEAPGSGPTAFSPWRRPEPKPGAVVASVVPPELYHEATAAMGRVRAVRLALDDMFRKAELCTDLSDGDMIVVQDLFREAQGVATVPVSRHDLASTARVCYMQSDWLHRIQLHLQHVLRNKQARAHQR
ncbi:Uncharacterized protein PBTT_04275 [Plasmodiophora brassicae]